MTFSSYGSGLTQAGENSYLLYGRRTPRNGTAKGVVLVHGHGGNAMQFQDWPTAQGAEAHALAGAGMLVLGIDVGGPNNWSGPAAMTAISNARSWLQSATGGGAAAGRIALMAWSMGGLGALNWIKRNPALVAGAWLWAPVSDLSWANGADATWSGEITAAFGSFAASAGYRVADEYASWRGICPIRVAHAVDDTTVPVTQSQAFVTGVNDPNVTFRSVPSGGHTGLFDQVPDTEPPAFFAGLGY